VYLGWLFSNPLIVVLSAAVSAADDAQPVRVTVVFLALTVLSGPATLAWAPAIITVLRSDTIAKLSNLRMGPSSLGTLKGARMNSAKHRCPERLLPPS
jgi:hypothetical protein